MTNANTWDNAGDEFNFRLLTSKEVYKFIPAIDRILHADTEKDFASKLNSFQRQLGELFQVSSNSPIPSIPDRGDGEPIVDLTSVGLGWNRQEGKKVNDSLRSLYDRSLLVDPLIETVGTVAVATLGIVPTSFTKRTVAGDTVYRKISAMLWEFEYQKEEDKESHQLHLRAEKTVTAIKSTVSYANEMLNKQQESQEEENP